MKSLDLKTTEKMGWIPDMPDHRDHYMTFTAKEAYDVHLKKKEGKKEIVDLRPQNGGFAIFDQGHLGSCTANALAAAFHFTHHKMFLDRKAFISTDSSRF